MTGTNHREGDTHNDVMEELFRHATARRRPPADYEEAVRTELHREWRRMTSRRRFNRFAIGVAALLLIGLAAGSLLLRQPPASGPVLQVAVVDRVHGRVTATASEARALRVETSSVLETGQLLETGHASKLALRWQNGISVRVDQNSRLRLVSESEIDLVSGRVYIDTRDAQSASGILHILTPAGSVSHVGTQYMAAVTASETCLTVRGGQVMLRLDNSDWTATAGEQLLIRVSEQPARSAAPTYGEIWQWAESLAPALAADNRSIADFLAWVSHESGMTIEFQSNEAQLLAQDTRLRGDVDREPMQALELVLRTTDLVGSVHSGAIVIAVRGEGG